MKYIIVTGDCVSNFQETVNLLIKGGYIPKGGISYANGFYVQAMIKTI